MKILTSSEQKASVLNAVEKASTKWKSAFNSGDAAGCATQYEVTAVMQARPFGTFTGTSEIQEFWQKLIDDGFTDVEYLKPRIEVIDKKSALLTSGWKMNKASGVIHKELWVVQQDGTAKLREDDFEATG
jgi:ketosteroid isomerase-like protein